jgi:hypothetical protein
MCHDVCGAGPLAHVCNWRQADVSSPHEHVRLTRQTGNHLNLLSISADGPTGLRCAMQPANR